MAGDGGGVTVQGMAEQLLSRIQNAMVMRPPAGVDGAYAAGFFLRNRGALLTFLQPVVTQLLAAAQQRGAGGVGGQVGHVGPQPGESQYPEYWSATRRTQANLAAMRLLAQKPAETITDADRRAIRLYSGWGGLSIEKVANQFPAGFPVPEAKGLLHEYYTPTRVWEAVEQTLRPHRSSLPTTPDATLRALEPSAGIGRALAAFQPWNAAWTALEMSPVSAKLLRALYPAANIAEGYAEKWIATVGMNKERPQAFGLIVANPPYGARGEARELDPDGYPTAQAYLYFVVRTLEMLEKDGICVQIIPTGLMSSKTPAFINHRTEMLRRAHLMAAFRLPSTPPEGGGPQDVAYDSFVVDVLFLRGRGGIAAAPPASDVAVIEGDYFKRNPGHVLGTVIGDGEGAENPGYRVRRGMQIQGRFDGFPAWTARPMQEVAVNPFFLRDAAKMRGGIAAANIDAALDAVPEDAPERIRVAVQLGVRADRHLAAVARGDAAGAAGGGELVRDLTAWKAANGVPAQDRVLVGLAVANQAAKRFLSLWTAAGVLVEGLAAKVAPAGYQGPHTLPAYAEWLYQQSGGLPLPVADLSKEAERHGLGRVDLARVQAELWAAGWRYDDRSTDTTAAVLREQEIVLEPQAAYLSGHLWPKYDRAVIRARAGDEWAARQVEDLRKAIGWTGGTQILKESAPNQGWIPMDMLMAFGESKTIFWPSYIGMERVDGILKPEDVGYGTLINTDKERTAGYARSALSFLGYCNGDAQLWKPERATSYNEAGEKVTEPVSEARKKQEDEWCKEWRAWGAADDERLARLEDAFNRQMRGYVPPTYSADPLAIARWGKGIKLHSYQVQGVRKLAANRCGLLAFDVGLGKTYSGLATMALARQEGWAKRPIILVPNTICWKWFRDVARCLPDYRVVVVGANRRPANKVTGRPISPEAAEKLGKGNWKWRSFLDTPEERAVKWTAFQAGAYDCAIVTYSAFARQQISKTFVEEYVGKTVAIRRAIALSLEQVEKAENVKSEDGKKGTIRKRTERSEADTQERARAWVGQKLAPPKGWQYDPGIDWHAIGIDYMMVDEAQNFKNLFYSSRESSADAEASKRAWALDFRCASVRKHSGGAGVVLLSATPMKNAATEFYNMLHLVNPRIWEQVAVTDPEGFVSLFANIEEKLVSNGSGGKEKRQVVTGFHHIEGLKGVVYRWATFKTAAQVGLKIPATERIQHIVRATEAQTRTFGSLFAELDAIQEKIKNTAKGGSDKSEQILRILMLKKQGIQMRLYLASIHPGLVGAPGSDLSLELDDEAWVIVNETKKKVGGPYTEKEQGLAALTKMIEALPELKWKPEAGPKLSECVKTILATAPLTCFDDEQTTEENGGRPFCLKCGHVVFAENVKVHAWLKELLVRGGLSAERIAILNAAEAPDLEQRQQIAEGFNGRELPGRDEFELPLYDVVIANAVAYEGIDLQRRTCAIHHIDVPWEPATLQQRNGRGVRQGNQFEQVGIHFYFVQGSSEAHRLGKIERKRGIMTSLFEEGASGTNTVEADKIEADDDVADSFIEFCPPHLQQKIKASAEEDRKRQEEESMAKARIQANRLLSDAVLVRRRITRLEAADELDDADQNRLALLRGEYVELVEADKTGLLAGRFPAALWPYEWHAMARAALSQDEVAVPVTGPPLFPGVQVRMTVVDAYYKGERTDEVMVGWVDTSGTSTTVRGTRPNGDVWSEGLKELNEVIAWESAILLTPTPEWFDKTFPSVVHHYGAAGTEIRAYGPWAAEVLWGRMVTLYAKQMRENRYSHIMRGQKPVLLRGTLRIDVGLSPPDGLLPPTPAGWQDFLKAVRRTDLKWKDLDGLTRSWWGREMPRGVAGADL